MYCLTRITHQMVQYPQGQTYVIPILISALPGIDFNDVKKTMITLDFYNTIFKLIICSDCSSAVHTHDDLTIVSAYLTKRDHFN
jgi:proteasome activator subunit 4